jgi:hypothetical protein
VIDISVFDSQDGRFCLAAMIEDKATDAVFEERGFQGGGYTWEAILRSLLGMRLPHALDCVDIGAEADNFYAYSENRDMLEQAASLLREAVADRSLLLAAIEHAGDDIE